MVLNLPGLGQALTTDFHRVMQGWHGLKLAQGRAYVQKHCSENKLAMPSRLGGGPTSYGALKCIQRTGAYLLGWPGPPIGELRAFPASTCRIRYMALLAKKLSRLFGPASWATEWTKS